MKYNLRQNERINIYFVYEINKNQKGKVSTPKETGILKVQFERRTP